MPEYKKKKTKTFFLFAFCCFDITFQTKTTWGGKYLLDFHYQVTIHQRNSGQELKQEVKSLANVHPAMQPR